MRSGSTEVLIVTPGTPSANNGNWRTAARWASMLRGPCRVIVQTQWVDAGAGVLIALHARRSAEAISRWRGPHPGAAVILVLTGTDLYRDLPAGDAQARASLDAADRIVVLQEDAIGRLEAPWRRKACVIYQSAPALRHRGCRTGPLRVVIVGHLREEKDPRTVFAAMRHLPKEFAIRVSHIGAPLDPALGAAARDLAREDPRYRYLGALPHGLTRAAIQRSDLLLHPSVMEGGANVIVEAIMAGTPVLASRMSGNIGMLGGSYPGYFEVGDPRGLAAALVRAADRPYWATLDLACGARRPLFTPRAEQAAVRRLVAEVTR